MRCLTIAGRQQRWLPFVSFSYTIENENRFTKRNASERHLKSAYPANAKNNNYYTGLIHNNQTIQNSALNSSIQMLNSTQQGNNFYVIFIIL